MRPSTAATLALVLSASTTAVQGASPPPEGGSIQALLTRYSARTHKALPLDAIPKDLKVNGTAAVGVVGNTTVLVVPVVPKNETASVQNPKAATKLVKRTKAKKEEDLAVEKRSFVIDSSVVEEPSSTAVANPSPSVLAAAQEAIVILSSVPSELALPVASSTEEAISSTARARKPYNPAHAKHNRRNDLSHDNRRRWVWSTSVIQDGDEDAPPAGSNEDLLTPGSTVDLNTPSVTLTPPSYSTSRAAKVAVESAHSARSSSKSSSSASQSSSASAAARKAHSASKSSASASKSQSSSASRSARSSSKSASSAAEEESSSSKSSATAAARAQRTSNKSATKSASSAEESSSSSSKAAAARAARTSSKPSSSASSSSSSSSERAHRPPRTSTTSSTTPSNAAARTPRTPKPTTSASDDSVAQVAALQAQAKAKVHTTILASRINRAKARMQPTDVLVEDDEGLEEEYSYYPEEDEEEEFDLQY